MINLAQMAQTLGTAAADSRAVLTLAVNAGGRCRLEGSWTRDGAECTSCSPNIPYDVDTVQAAFRVIISEAQV